MPTFEIPDGPTSIEAARSGDPQNPRPAEASAVYSVTNTSSDSLDGRLSVVVSGASKAQWFTVDGDRERTFGAGETQTATIKASFPPEVAGGDYPFRLRVIAVNDPDNDHAEGPMTTARLAPIGVVVIKKSWTWLWILLGVLAAIVIAIGLYFALSGGGGPSAALKKAEKKSADWAEVYSKHDLKGVSAMSKAPFFLDDGAVLQKQADIQKKYQAKFAPSPLPAGTDAKDSGEIDNGWKFDKVSARLVSQYKQEVGPNPELDRAIADMKLGEDDIVVVGDTQGVTTILFFRRDGVELAGVVD